MGHGPSLCLQLFLDDSKMKNFITCFKGTAAPSSPTFLTPSGEALEGSAPQPATAGEWASAFQSEVATALRQPAPALGEPFAWEPWVPGTVSNLCPSIP